MTISTPEKQYASESDRWYDPKTQESVNDCLSAKGLPKKVTLREARKEGYVPSVTTILHSLSKPALEKWKIRQYLEVAHRSRGFHLDHDEWIKYVVQTGDEEMDVARDKGQEVHGKVDRWLEDGMPEPPCAFTKAARNALEHIGVYGCQFECERTMAVKIGDVWVAGKTDLVFHQGVIVDWKSTKAECDGTERLGWDEHVIQMACYSMALFGKPVDCWNVFLSTTREGFYQCIPWNEEELERGWEMYIHAYHLWTLTKNYRP
jgi:hypothetical protein